MSTNASSAYGAPLEEYRPDDRAPLLEIRPDAATFWRGVKFRALIFLPLVALGFYRTAGRSGIAWPVLVFGGLILVLAVGALTMLQTSSVVLTASTIEKHRRWLPPKIVQRATVASGVLVPQYTSAFNRTAPLLILVGGHGRPLIRLTGQVFARSDLFALAQRIGYSAFDVIDEVAGPKSVSARHRRVLPLIERRPGLIIVAGTVLLLVAVVVGVTIFAPVS